MKYLVITVSVLAVLIVGYLIYIYSGIYNISAMDPKTSGGMGGHMDFSSNVKFQFHYNNSQANRFITNSGNMKVQYWENKTAQWNIASNPVI